MFVSLSLVNDLFNLIMLLQIAEDYKNSLSFLTAVSTDVLQDFSRISLEFIKKDINPKIFQSAAAKLGESVDTVRNGVEALMYIFSESAKYPLSAEDFAEVVVGCGFAANHQAVLSADYEAGLPALCDAHRELAPQLLQYHDLEWRLQVQVASRTLHHQLQPELLLKLHLQGSPNLPYQTHILQTDPCNLLHLTETLEEALAAMRAQHVRRVLRNL